MSESNRNDSNRIDTHFSTHKPFTPMHAASLSVLLLLACEQPFVFHVLDETAEQTREDGGKVSA